MAMHVTVDTLLDRVKDIAPMLRAYAAEAEAQRRLARPVVDAMLQAGLYSMSHPKAFGGLEVDPLTMFRVVEAVAYQDSAAGWNMQMSVGASCFLAWLPDEGAAEILTSHPTPIVAGTSSIRNEFKFQQYFRDVHTITQHAFVSASRYESAGALMLGEESDWGFFAF